MAAKPKELEAMDRSTIVLDEERLFLRGSLTGALGTRRRPFRTHQRNRICTAQGCTTRLSIYNSSALCWQHQARRPYVQRAERRTALSA
jgi:hypothetical protein